MKSFEEYLQDVWEPEGVLDDDMPDAFDAFMEGMDAQEIIDYADDYGKFCYKEGIKKGFIDAEIKANQEMGDTITKDELLSNPH